MLARIKETKYQFDSIFRKPETIKKTSSFGNKKTKKTQKFKMLKLKIEAQ